MKLFLAILVLAAVPQLLLPWWALAAVALLLGTLLARRGGQAFLAGFGGAALGWLLPASYLYVRNGGHLANRVAELLPLGGQGWAVVLVAAVIAGLVGALAALTGCWLREAISPTSADTVSA
ncbi:hypothetical protein [Solirubrum puertoriconensis]|uniref:Uncharacterized protein n=1 Tax=Solirubrum puertoriconensis TaxID=1751427 RepID=A0A9X0HHT5_SOLP1|nr:hypothetical protein [Solirubrum puertoriconensis]KUG06144.1 hypothetical protein ASU33_01900 [Solirubrum puertoriconensis]